eukprot:5118037-Pyramimonas_sp.AAC.1
MVSASPRCCATGLRVSLASNGPWVAYMAYQEFTWSERCVKRFLRCLEGIAEGPACLKVVHRRSRRHR